jgi:hypothetical protein
MMLSWKRRLVGLAVGLGAVGCHVPGPTSPEHPTAGVPSIELDLLKREYRLGEEPCTRTAEEVVDIQRRCSEAHWADCVYAGTMYWHGRGVAENLTGSHNTAEIAGTSVGRKKPGRTNRVMGAACR